MTNWLKWRWLKIFFSFILVQCNSRNTAQQHWWLINYIAGMQPLSEKTHWLHETFCEPFIFSPMQLWAWLFAFVSAQGDAAFLHYRQMETWSSKTSGSTCYPSYPLGLKMRVRAHREERTERDRSTEESRKPFMWRKQQWMWKGRGNC